MSEWQVETGTQIDRRTDRQTDRPKHTRINKQTDRQTDRQVHWQRGRPTERQTDTGRPTDVQEDQHTDKLTNRPKEKQADRAKDRQTDIQTNRQVGRGRESSYPETKAIISFLSARRPQDDVSVNEWTLKTCKGKPMYVNLTSGFSNIKICKHSIATAIR